MPAAEPVLRCVALFLVAAGKMCGFVKSFSPLTWHN
jgi:hypothetical protein